MSRAAVALERLAILLCSLALSVGLIVLLSGYFAGRDQAGVTASPPAPGIAFADLGHRHLRPGQAHPVYDSDPPTSGAHVPVGLTRQYRPLGDDALLQALEAGDVVIFYGSPRPPRALQALAAGLAAPFSPALAASGRAIVLAPRPGTRGVLAVAWAHMLPAGGAQAPALRSFITYWLGRRHD